MHGPTPTRFKKAFMAQLLLSLRAAGQAPKSMCLRERRDAVRLSSDVAMALASSSSARPAAWARGLLAKHAAERRNEALLRRIMGGAGYEMAAAAGSCRKEARCRRIVRRSRRVVLSAGRQRSSGSGGSGGAMAARRMVRARMQVLRTLVPGADGLRGFSLLSETLDYVACLKTQVELMQCLCRGSQSRIPGTVKRC
jgi:hypothetical protein